MPFWHNFGNSSVYRRAKFWYYGILQPKLFIKQSCQVPLDMGFY